MVSAREGKASGGRGRHKSDSAGVGIRSGPVVSAASCCRNGDGVVSLDIPGEGIR